MPVQLGSRHPRRYVLLGGILADIAGTNTSVTTMVEGSLYRLTCLSDGAQANTGGGAVCRWGTADAADSSANFDFAIAAGESMVVEAQDTELNFIGASGTLTASVYIQELAADY